MSTPVTPPEAPRRAKANGRRSRSTVTEFENAIAAEAVTLEHLVDALALRRATRDAESRALYDGYFSRLTKAYQLGGATIEDSFFCQNLAGGALLTKRPGPKRRWRRSSKHTYRIHIRYPTESVLAVTPDFAEALWRSVALSKRATQLLRTQNSIALHKSMYSVVVYLLSVLDTVRGEARSSEQGEDEDSRRKRIEMAVADAHKHLDQAARQFDACTRWGSNFAYFNGMLIGLAVLAACVAAAVLVLRNNQDARTFLAVTSAGGAGAVVSVMSRMGSRAFYLDPLAEHRAVRLLGTFRPLIGAVFGAATFLIVAGGLLDVVPAAVEAAEPATRLYYFSALGFIAGFNERFATGVLSNAASRAGGKARPEAEEDLVPSSPSGVLDEHQLETRSRRE
jgi:hypothetical protein